MVQSIVMADSKHESAIATAIHWPVAAAASQAESTPPTVSLLPICCLF